MNIKQNFEDLGNYNHFSNQNQNEFQENSSWKEDLLAELSTLISSYDRTALTAVQEKEDEAKAWQKVLDTVDQHIETNSIQLDENSIEKLEDRWEKERVIREFLMDLSNTFQSEE